MQLSYTPACYYQWDWILVILKFRCMDEVVTVHLCFLFHVENKEHSISLSILTSLWQNSECHRWSAYSAPGERMQYICHGNDHTQLYRQNIKHILVGCLLKSRTNFRVLREGAPPHTHTSIFRVKLHFPNPQVCVLLSTHILPLLPYKHHNFVNGLPPCSHPRIRYSMKPGASCYDFWFPVSCKKKKIQPPFSHTNTLISSTTCHTLNRAGLGSAANTTFQIF